METELTCLLCGKSFHPTCHISRQKYCSRECRVKYNNAKRHFDGKVNVCPNCDKDIKQEQGGRRQRFCDEKCRWEYNRKKLHEQRKEEREKVCPNCGKEFQPKWKTGRQQRFCCEQCRKTWWNEYRKTNEAQAEPNCIYCGKEIEFRKRGIAKYCSRYCYLQDVSQLKIEKNCEYCRGKFLSPESAQRKYCSIGCANAVRGKQQESVEGWRCISTRKPLAWQRQLTELARVHVTTSKRRIFLACSIVSAKHSVDVLTEMVKFQLKCNPFDGNLYVFCQSHCRQLKWLEWDGSGFCVGYRRAEYGTYPWPSDEDGPVVEIGEKEFAFLLGKSIVPKVGLAL